MVFIAEAEQEKGMKERQAERDAELARRWEKRAAEERALSQKRRSRKRQRPLSSVPGALSAFGEAAKGEERPGERGTWERRVRKRKHGEGDVVMAVESDPYARLFRKVVL